jgi:uncharacterized membrane protein
MQKQLQPLVLLMLCATSTACSAEGEPVTATATTGEVPSGSLTWCDVAPILEAKCQRCHAEPTENGAPFPLETYADTQVEESSKRSHLMRSAVSTDFMPPTVFRLEPPVEPLTCEEKRTLLAWLDDGTPPAKDETCQDEAPTLLACE